MTLAISLMVEDIASMAGDVLVMVSVKSVLNGFHSGKSSSKSLSIEGSKLMCT